MREFGGFTYNYYGPFIYAIGVNYYFNEGLNPKTIVSLCIALLLICIQVLWK